MQAAEEAWQVLRPPLLLVCSHTLSMEKLELWLPFVQRVCFDGLKCPLCEAFIRWTSAER